MPKKSDGQSPKKTKSQKSNRPAKLNLDQNFQAEEPFDGLGILNKVEFLIAASEPNESKKLLAAYLKKTKLTPQDRVRISEIYRTLSENDKAIKILGQELGPTELIVVSSDELLLQLRLAYMLQYMGVRYFAERLFRNIEQAVKDRKISLPHLDPLYDRYRCSHHLGRQNFTKALEHAELALKGLTHDRKSWKATAINKVACLFSLKRYDEAEKFLNYLLTVIKDEDSHYSAECHHRLADIYLEINNLPSAFKALEEALPQLSKTHTVDFLFIHRSLAIYYFKMNDLEKAHHYLSECEKFPLYKQTAPVIRLSILYWKEKMGLGPNPISEMLALRSHLTFSPYSYSIGRHYPPKSEFTLRTFFGQDYVHRPENCWLINQNQISGINYHGNTKNLLENAKIKDIIIDLVHGILFRQNNEKIEVLYLLTEMQAKVLSILMGAGDIGLTKWAIIEFLYRQDFFNSKSGEERIKKLVQSLKEILQIKIGNKVQILPFQGSTIERENNTFFTTTPKDSSVILHMNHSFLGPAPVFLSLFPEFVRLNLEDFFHIKTSTAKTWIEEWTASGLIQSDGQGKNIKYKVQPSLVH